MPTFLKQIQNQQQLRKAFRTAQMIGSRAAGAAGVILSGVVGDAQSANYSPQVGEFFAQKAKAKKNLEQQRPK